MADLELDINSPTRQSYALGLSVGLHAAVLFLMLFNFAWSTDDFDKNPPAILMVDLSKVELADKTNLPPEVKVKKEVKPQPAEKPKPKPEPKPKAPEKATKTPTVKQEAPAPKAEPVKPQEKPVQKDAVKVQEPPKPKEQPKKTEKKPVKKEPPKPKPTAKPTPQKPKPSQTQPKQTSGLQSLLASVEQVKKPINPALSREEVASEPTGQEINNGIKGGTSGSRLEALTISEKDLIANKIRDCWNVNAGVEGADSMIIELKAFVNRDGRIKDVRILNSKNNPVFKSMAESARRAIYVCDAKGDDSPFKILAVKHPENYNSWKEIHLRMNPVDGGVF